MVLLVKVKLLPLTYFVPVPLANVFQPPNENPVLVSVPVLPGIVTDPLPVIVVGTLPVDALFESKESCAEAIVNGIFIKTSSFQFVRDVGQCVQSVFPLPQLDGPIPIPGVVVE